MASLEITIIILTIVQGNLAGYYYKEVDGTYDVYYGDKAFWGYRELKPPKSMKTDFDMRGDRPGMCGKGDFICQEPYSIKETEAFECDVDYQCPRYFKCCKPNCFQHKICQPALETDKENSEPTSKNLPTFTTPPKTIKTVTTKKVSPVISTKASTTAPTPTSTSIRTTKASTTKKPVTTTKAFTTAPTTTSTSTRTTKASTTKKLITTTKTSATVYSTTTPTSVASTTINITTTSLMPTTNPLFSTTVFNTSTSKPTSTTENKTIKPDTIPVTESSIAIPSTKVTEVTNMYTSVRSTPASLATEAVTTKSSSESSSTNIPLMSFFTTESVRTTLLTGQSNSTIATTSLPVLTTQAGSSDLSTNNFNTNTTTKTINTSIFLATTKPYPSTTLVPLMNRTLTSLHTKREQFASTNSIHDTVNTTTVATDSNISLSGKTKNIPSTYTFTTSSVKATFLTIKPNSTIETTTSVPVLTTPTTIRILDFTNTTNTDNIKTTRKTVSTSASSATAKYHTTTLEPVPNTTLTSFQPTVSEQFTNTQSIHETVNTTRVTTIRHNISSPLTTTKETTISHMTSDDEDLTFSGDHEITDSTSNFKETTDVTNYTVMPKPTSTELTPLTTIERTSDEVILSTELFNTTPKWSTDNLTTRQLDVTVKYNTSVTKQSLNDTTDDEDLTFSGDSELVTEDFHSEHDKLSTETTLATANLSTKSLESLTTQDLSFTNESTTFNILPLINETAEWTIPVNNLLTRESITIDYNTTSNTADTSHSNITQQTTDDNFTTAVFKATTSDITEYKGLSTINSINSSIEYDAPTSKSPDKTTSSTSSTIEINNITISQFATDDEDLTYSGDGSGYGTDRIIITEDTTTGDVNVSEDDIIFITDNEYNFKQLYSNKTDVSNIANTTNEDTQIYTISEENEKLSTTPIHRETTNTRNDDIFSSSSKSLLRTAQSGVTTSTGLLRDTGTGVVIINNLLGELRKIPSMIENGSNNSTNHYFTTFLEFMYKLIPIFKDNKSGTEPDHTNLTGTTEPTANNSTTFEYDQEINDIPQ